MTTPDLIARTKAFLDTVRHSGWTPEREDTCTDLLDAILTTLSASDADTVRVPREPTELMLRAGEMALDVRGLVVDYEDALSVWSAMLTAAHPKPEPTKKQPSCAFP